MFETNIVKTICTMKLIKLALLLSTFFFLSNCKSQLNNQKSIKDALVAHSYNDIDVAILYYKTLKEADEAGYSFNDENELNILGYQLLNDNRVNDAIKVFKLLVSEFPNSENSYDSLGEAYNINGNKRLALFNYKKSLELNPKNDNADRVIISIENESRKRNKFYNIYTKKEYLDDLDELATKLTTVNPHPYKFTDKQYFWQVVEDKKSSITDTTTYGEFIWYCSELIATINCGHSGLGYFNQENEMLPVKFRFPLETRFIDKKLFVTESLLNSQAKEGSEILAINGVSVGEVREEIFKHISSQGHIETSKALLFSAYGTAYVPYALGFPQKYNITIASEKSPIELKLLSTYKNPQRHFPTKLCESKDLCLDFVDDETAVLTIINSGAYYGNKFSVFKDFIDTSFLDINSKNIKNLIVDMRSNSGGPGNTGIYLLQYLANAPFIYKKVSEGSNVAERSFKPFANRFKGETFFLIDGDGKSTTGHILSFVKEQKTATIIGEELGGNQFCTGGQRPFKLPNSEVFYFIGRYTNISSADSFPDDRGIMPDHFVTQNIQDYLNDRDTVMRYTLNLIKNK